MSEKNQINQPEPWLRATLSDVPVVARAAIHALQLAKEDLHRWASPLTEDELNYRPSGLPSVAFHMRHIAGSLDRLLTYAENRQLAPHQIAFLKCEPDSIGHPISSFTDFDRVLEQSEARIRVLANADLNEKREVGGKKLPTTVGSLLVHVADHTQRHVGQAITTAKILLVNRTPRQ
jgi:uncharacterized damage-inducible protein DinB